MTKTLFSKSPFFLWVAWFFLQLPSMALALDTPLSRQKHPSSIQSFNHEKRDITRQKIKAFYEKIDSYQVQSLIKALKSTDSAEDVIKVIEILDTLHKKTPVPEISNFLDYYHQFLKESLPYLPKESSKDSSFNIPTT